mmetsp:Transcript_9515/g.28876  ORF Transcript_9515/g.28876 Transcript_9515/m.28876 type:complete len:262 (+) Transcript_9515:134-919(+)
MPVAVQTARNIGRAAVSAPAVGPAAFGTPVHAPHCAVGRHCQHKPRVRRRWPSLPHPAAVELSNAARPPQVCARELRAVDVHTFHAQQLQPVLLAQRRRAVRKPGRQRFADELPQRGHVALAAQQAQCGLKRRRRALQELAAVKLLLHRLVHHALADAGGVRQQRRTQRAHQRPSWPCQPCDGCGLHRRVPQPQPRRHLHQALQAVHLGGLKPSLHFVCGAHEGEVLVHICLILVVVLIVFILIATAAPCLPAAALWPLAT